MKEHQHLLIIDQAILEINIITGRPFVLKGGTALMMCYDLDRMSEDIDLDCDNNSISENRDKLFRAIEGLSTQFSDGHIRVAKDTDTTQRIMLHYGGNRPLKIEASYRRNYIPGTESKIINGIRTYEINALCRQKAAAYLGRDKIRDLYDLTYIVDKYFDKLDAHTIDTVRSAFEYKDIEQFDYLVATQDDPLINKEVLEDRFLLSFAKTGLLEPAYNRITPDNEPVQVEAAERAESARKVFTDDKNNDVER